MYELNDKVCGVMKVLLSICGVMGIHMYIALVGKDWGHEQGLIMMYVRWSHYKCKLMWLTVQPIDSWLTCVFDMLCLYDDIC